ncbi:MAG: TlpA family protein disulfide reductase [Flavobacteriales bacterium]|nr:TlpA family protein disulfide reductase [Flavobacteriales bacterium]
MTANSLVDTQGYIVKVGDKAPDFEMDMIDGTKAKLSDYAGKIVMLQFTASWCSVCRREMPVIEEEVWKVNQHKNFVLIGIDRDEPLDVVIDFAKKMGVTYPLALDPGANIFGLFADKKSGVTRNVIIDEDGNIAFLTRLFERTEFDEMKEVIQNLLNN